MKVNYSVKRYKFKYFQKQLYRLKGITSSNFINNIKNNYFLKSLNSLFLSSSQIEAARRIMRHFLRKSLIILINFKGVKSYSEKSNGTRMGKGKGYIKDWLMPVKKGLLLFTLSNLNLFQAIFLLTKAKKKLKIKSLVLRNNMYKVLNFNFFIY